MDVKRCSRCNTTKRLDQFYKNAARKDGVGIYCRLCEIEMKRQYQLSPRGREVARANAKKRRQSLVASFGGRCTCCGESIYEFMQFDHIDGDGAEHRRSLGRKNVVTSDVQKTPERFQLHCANCNFAKGMWGQCPHQKNPRRALTLL